MCQLSQVSAPGGRRGPHTSVAWDVPFKRYQDRVIPILSGVSSVYMRWARSGAGQSVPAPSVAHLLR